MTYKKYNEKEFEQWCEDNFIDETVSTPIWALIKDFDVILDLNDLVTMEGVFQGEIIIKLMVHEV